MKIFKRILMIFLLLIVAIVVAVFVFMQHPKFGKMPSGERLEKIKKSPHFQDGKFQNLSITPDLKEGVGYYTVMKEFFFNKSKRDKPATALPSKKIDLLKLPPEEDILVWFGHSSYYLQLNGKKILVDPVLGGSASPVRFTTLAFTGTDVYTTDDIPPIDYLFITHDHWDHLDYETILKMKHKVGKIITGLGTGAHLEHWGFDTGMIIEKDWNESAILDPGFIVNFSPARHFSGRGFSRNGSLWMSFVFTTPGKKIYIGGDSGYDTHFAKIGNDHGPFDLVILECGQYNEYWKYIHMMPEEVVLAAIDLKAKKLMPVHWSKFSLALHDWDDPIIRVTKEATLKNMPIVYPIIGEAVFLGKDEIFNNWWEQVK